ncbi:MAG: hypothetical protein ACE5HO_02780 [bacterium]
MPEEKEKKEEKEKSQEQEQPVKEPNYHTYEPNAVPWWLALLWLGYFIFGVVYLLRNLL